MQEYRRWNLFALIDVDLATTTASSSAALFKLDRSENWVGVQCARPDKLKLLRSEVTAHVQPKRYVQYTVVCKSLVNKSAVVIQH